MIGAGVSPMSMFNPGGGDAFQRGMIIGNANSPFSSVAEALKSTVDRYHQHLDNQQEQQNKIDLIKQEYGLKQQMANTTPDPDAAGPFTQVDPKTGKAFIRSTTIDATGRSRVGWSPVSPNSPEDPSKRLKGIMLGPMIEQMQAQINGVPPEGSSPIPGVPLAPAQMSAPQMSMAQPTAGQPVDPQDAALAAQINAAFKQYKTPSTR